LDCANDGDLKLPELIDFHDTRPRSPILAIFAIIIVGTVLGLILILTIGSSRHPVLIGVSVALIVGIGAWLWQFRREKSTKSRIELGHAAPLVDLLPIILPQDPFVPEFALGKLIGTLVAHGRTGETVRVWRKKTPPPIIPLEKQFEPVLVDESVPLFSALEQDDESLSTSIGSDAESEWRELARGWQRFVKLRGGVLYVVFLVFYLVLVIFDLIQGIGMSKGSILGLSWLFLAILGFGYSSASQSQQWLLVPGGFASRRSKTFQSASELHLFVRGKCMLIAQETVRKTWFVYVADVQTSQMAQMTAREAHLLLRAWLSPIPPPPIERLSDLQSQ